MSLVVIALAGNAGHGKDAYGKFLIDAINRTPINIKAQRFAFADALKNDCKEFDDWDGNKLSDVYISWINDKPMQVYLDEKDAQFHADNIGGFISRHIGGRKLLQGKGVFGRKVGGENYWVKRCFEKIYECREHDFVAVITDARFVNEITQVSSFFVGSECIKIKRPGGPFISREAAAHISETEQNTKAFLDKIDTFIDNNNTLESLQEQAIEHARIIVRNYL